MCISTGHRNMKRYACCDEHSVILCHVDTVCWASVHCMCTFRGPILYGVMMCCNGSIYGQILGVICSYMYLCTVSSEGSMSSTKDKLCGNSTCTKSSCQKEYMYRGYVQQYTESQCIKSVACTNMHNSCLINGIECMRISQCLSVCVPSLPDRFIVCHIHV